LAGHWIWEDRGSFYTRLVLQYWLLLAWILDFLQLGSAGAMCSWWATWTLIDPGRVFNRVLDIIAPKGGNSDVWFYGHVRMLDAGR